MKNTRRKWKLLPTIRFINYRKEYPNHCQGLWRQWFTIERYWSGKLVFIRSRHLAVELDFRSNWLLDMMGK